MVAKEDKKGTARTTVPRNVTVNDLAAGGTVGNALRSVYDETVSEDIPGEMLDLLGKLA